MSDIVLESSKRKQSLRVGMAVKVLVGDDRGVIGVVSKVLRLKNGLVTKVVVQGVALSQRLVKGSGGAASVFITSERAIDVSNVAVVQS